MSDDEHRKNQTFFFFECPVCVYAFVVVVFCAHIKYTISYSESIWGAIWSKMRLVRDWWLKRNFVCFASNITGSFATLPPRLTYLYTLLALYSILFVCFFLLFWFNLVRWFFFVFAKVCARANQKVIDRAPVCDNCLAHVLVRRRSGVVVFKTIKRKKGFCFWNKEWHQQKFLTIQTKL